MLLRAGQGMSFQNIWAADLRGRRPQPSQYLIEFLLEAKPWRPPRVAGVIAGKPAAPFAWNADAGPKHSTPSTASLVSMRGQKNETRSSHPSSR